MPATIQGNRRTIISSSSSSSSSRTTASLRTTGATRTKAKAITTSNTSILRTSRSNKNTDAADEPLQELLQSSVAVRVFQIESPLLLFFFLVLSFQVLSVYTTSTILPRLKAYEWTDKRRNAEQIYPAFHCGPEALSTNSSRDLYIDPTVVAEATDKVMLHGAGMFPDIVTLDHASALRKYVLRRNRDLDQNGGLPIIEGNRRWSFAMHPNDDDASIRPVLEDIAHHAVLQSTLKDLLGPNPAIVELSAMTAAHGAAHQYFHSDTVPEASALMFDAFTNLYSLLIPLQDITSSTMGPTHVCPGSHRCANMDVCREVGYSAMATTEPWRAGTGLLYNSQLRHRGSGHFDVDLPARVAMIISFASRPSSSSSSSSPILLPDGAVYAMKWNTWGWTVDDFRNWPSDIWQIPLGSGRGWTVWKSWAVRMVNEMYPFGKNELIVMLQKKEALWSKLPFFLQGPVVSSSNTNESTNTEDGSGAWINYFVGVIERCKWFFGFLYAAFLILNIVVLTADGTGDVSYKWSVIRLSFGHVVLALVVWVTWQHAGSTFLHSLPAVRTETLADQSSLGKHRSRNQAHTQKSGSPTFDDVLFATSNRSTSRHAYRHLLDYHGGNLRFHQMLDDYMPLVRQYCFSSSVPTIFCNSGVVDSILSSTIGNTGETGFYKEEQSTGDWIELNHMEAKGLIKAEVVNHFLYPTRALLTSSRQVCKFRNGSAASALCSIQPIVFERIFSAILNSEAETTRMANHEQPESNRWLLRERLAVPLTRSSRDHDDVDSSVNAAYSQPYHEGMRIEGYPSPIIRKWWKGTLVRRSVKEGIWNVQFDVGERTTVSESNLRPMPSSRGPLLLAKQLYQLTRRTK